MKISVQVYVCVCVHTGMPFNQLGTLAGSGCYGLNAAYYYIRWSACFSSAEIIFELNYAYFTCKVIAC